MVLQVRPGVGTVCNMLFIGPWLDLLRTLDWFPRFAGGIPGTAQFVGGMPDGRGLQTAIYIGARMGAGPAGWVQHGIGEAGLGTRCAARGSLSNSSCSDSHSSWAVRSDWVRSCSRS